MVREMVAAFRTLSALTLMAGLAYKPARQGSASFAITIVGGLRNPCRPPAACGRTFGRLWSTTCLERAVGRWRLDTTFPLWGGCC
jgi:hypothetical protein